ncbi:hypothetical protein SKAU_G00421830 [Synaphobranchus kaupii]|uniref:Cystatin-B n=1 Tax=Synaphobranchus kaupii TaxID=118154 RepID=A0A9Q1IB72_SYNKA|nr:hypothetical protein SKAU_G00421830 [Synaphobranchus kaupii]
MQGMCGGAGAPQDATPEVQDICDELQTSNVAWVVGTQTRSLGLFLPRIRFRITVLKVKPQAEDKAGKKFDDFNAKSFTTQVVAGTNFFIKVHVGGDEHVHLRVYRPLPHTNKPLELHSLQTDKAAHEPIGYF